MKCTFGRFQGRAARWQISNAGGQLPVWSRNGRELFFQNLDNRIMVTDYTATEDSFVARQAAPVVRSATSRRQRNSELRPGAGRQALRNIP